MTKQFEDDLYYIPIALKIVDIFRASIQKLASTKKCNRILLPFPAHSLGRWLYTLHETHIGDDFQWNIFRNCIA